MCEAWVLGYHGCALDSWYHRRTRLKAAALDELRRVRLRSHKRGEVDRFFGRLLLGAHHRKRLFDWVLRTHVQDRQRVIIGKPVEC